jgi:hypothetical protein
VPKIYDKDSLFNKCCWESWICRKLKLDPCLSHYININSKWIKDLNIRLGTLKPVQERVGNILELTDISNNFLNRTPMLQQLRERTDKWDNMKLKSLCTKMELVTRLKRQPTD